MALQHWSGLYKHSFSSGCPLRQWSSNPQGRGPQLAAGGNLFCNRSSARFDVSKFVPHLISRRLPFNQMNFKPVSDETSFLRMKMFISFSLFIFRDACPVRPSPSTRQVSQITQYHSEKRAGMGVCCAHLISWPQVSPRCSEKELMYHIPGSLWVSYGLLQKLRQMHSARSFVCVHLLMTQGAFLLLDLYILKMQDNAEALWAVKAPGVCTNRSSQPQHVAYVWLVEGAALYKLPNPWPLCSKHS